MALIWFQATEVRESKHSVPKLFVVFSVDLDRIWWSIETFYSVEPNSHFVAFNQYWRETTARVFSEEK